MTTIQGELWEKLKQSVGDSDLVDIANSDYGEDAEEHYKALISIYKYNRMPTVLLWEPREVLQLSHWAKYLKENKSDVVVVLFCSFLLLEALRNEENFDYSQGENQSIIIAIDCANKLGEDWLGLFNEYLKEFYRTINKARLEEEVIYFSLSVSLINIMLDDKLSFISWSKITENNILNIEKLGFVKKNNRVLGYTCFDIKHKLWKHYLDKFKTEYRHSPLSKYFNFSH